MPRPASDLPAESTRADATGLLDLLRPYLDDSNPIGPDVVRLHEKVVRDLLEQLNTMLYRPPDTEGRERLLALRGHWESVFYALADGRAPTDRPEPPTGAPEPTPVGDAAPSGFPSGPDVEPGSEGDTPVDGVRTPPAAADPSSSDQSGADDDAVPVPDEPRTSLAALLTEIHLDLRLPVQDLQLDQMSAGELWERIHLGSLRGRPEQRVDWRCRAAQAARLDEELDDLLLIPAYDDRAELSVDAAAFRDVTSPVGRHLAGYRGKAGDVAEQYEPLLEALAAARALLDRDGDLRIIGIGSKEWQTTPPSKDTFDTKCGDFLNRLARADDPVNRALDLHEIAAAVCWVAHAVPAVDGSWWSANASAATRCASEALPDGYSAEPVRGSAYFISKDVDWREEHWVYGNPDRGGQLAWWIRPIIRYGNGTKVKARGMVLAWAK
jgi:hypothetical protein